MNHRELVAELSKRLNKTQKDTSSTIEEFVSVLKEELMKNSSISFSGFGLFEVRKRGERISKNPASQKRMLIPPKLVVNFKPSNLFKEKLKEIDER